LKKQSEAKIQSKFRNFTEKGENIYAHRKGMLAEKSTGIWCRKTQWTFCRDRKKMCLIM